MPTLDDIAGATGKGKQELQQALLDLLKGNPDILNSVANSASRQGGQAAERAEIPARSGDEDDRRTQRSPSASFPELENSLNQQRRGSYQWQLSDSDDGIDSAWTTATRNMTPRELSRWRRNLFSIYVGHLPCDITKKELVQLFSEVGSVQDVHLQPAREGGYTYGFIRFCTLDECRDAVSMIHGRLLGNRTITVEYACETKERLRGDDPSDLPLDKKDKLLRNDYPKFDRSVRPMSDAESQEKMILWKLRCSATKQLSSPTGFEKSITTNGQESSKEELMSRIQEIVKKVSSLPADTFALPSGSEGSPCSDWILKDINGNCVSEELGQSHSAQYPDKNKEENKEVLSSNGTQQNDAPPIATAQHSQTQTHLFRERQAQALEVNAVTFSSPPNTQRMMHDPFEASPPSEVPLSPRREESSQSEKETTASDSASLGSLSPERKKIIQHCQFCHRLSPARGHVSESSQSESTSSSSSRQSPASPCTFCHQGEDFLNNQDDSYTLHEQDVSSSQRGREPWHESVQTKDGASHGPPTGNHLRNMGLCSFDTDNDNFIGNTEFHNEGQKQTQYSSAIHQPRQTSMPTQYTRQGFQYAANQANRPFGPQSLLGEPPHKITDSSGIPQPKQFSNPGQDTNLGQRPVVNQANRPFVQQSLLGDPPYNNTDLSGIPQLTQVFNPGQDTNLRQMPVSNQANRPFVQQSLLGDPPHNNADLSGIPQLTQVFNPGQDTNLRQTPVSNQVNRPFGQQSILGDPLHNNADLSGIPQLPQVFNPGQDTNLRQTPVSNQVNRPFGQQSILGDPPHNNAALSGIPKLTQVSNPGQDTNLGQTPVGNQANRPFGQQSLLGDPSHKNNDLSGIPQPKQVSISGQDTNLGQRPVPNQANRPFGQQSLLGDPSHKNTDLSGIPQPKQVSISGQDTNLGQRPVANQANRPFGQQSLLGDPPHNNTDLSGIPQPKQVSISGQDTNLEQRPAANQANRPFVQQSLLGDPPHKNTDLSGIPQPKQVSIPGQDINLGQTPVSNQANRPFGQQSLLGDPSHKNTDLSGIPQPKQVSISGQDPNLGQRPVTNQANRPFGQQSLFGVPPHNNTDLSGIPQPKQVSIPGQDTNMGQWPVTNQANRPFGQQSLLGNPSHNDTDLSGIPQLKQVSSPGQNTNLEQMPVSNQANRPFGQQAVLSDLSHATNTDSLKGDQCSPNIPLQTRASIPGQDQMHVPNEANRPLGQQGLLSNPPSLPSQTQAILANMVTPGWQQTGFPRHPFLAPSVINPGFFQGWNGNALLQQQLLASGLPFGAPFHARGHQPWPRAGIRARGPVPRPGQGSQMPFGRTGMGPIGRGRAFAPRFHSPGAQNRGGAQKIVPGVFSAVRLESSLPVDEISSESCNDKVEHSHPTTDDLQKSGIRPPVTSTSSDSNYLESGKVKSSPTSSLETSDTKPSTIPEPSLGTTVDSVSRESFEFKSSSVGSAKESNIKPSTAPSPERYKDVTSSPEVRKASEEGFGLASPPDSTLPRQEDDLESPGAKTTSPHRMSQSELLLKEEKAEFKRVVRDNERLRQCIDWQRAGGIADGASSKESGEALKAQIHLKEVQLQKEKEMIMARKAEQELLYEREKLEAAFDQQMKKELETEQRIGETKNKIHLAKLESELLRLYQDLHGTREISDSTVIADEKRC